MIVKSQFFAKLLTELKDESKASAMLPLPVSYWQLLHFAFQLLPGAIVVAACLGIVAGSTIFLVSVLSSFIFSHIYEMGLSQFLILFIVFGLFFFAAAFFSFLNQLYVKNINIKINCELLPRVWNHLLSLPWAFYKKSASVDVVQRLMDYEAIISVLVMESFLMLFNGFILLFLLICLFYCHFYLGLLYFLVGISFFLIRMGLVFINNQYIDLQFMSRSKLFAFLNDILLQIHKIRSACVEAIVFKRWLNQLVIVKMYVERSVKLEIFGVVFGSLLSLILLLLLYGVLFWSPGFLSGEKLLQFIVCSWQFVMMLEKMALQMISFMQVLPGLKRMRLILSEPHEEVSIGTSRLHMRRNIELKNIFLRDMRDISLTIEAGKFVAIVGPSGSGKSSLLRLLLGFEQATSGIIKVDGVNFQDLDINYFREQLGVVLQTTNLLPGTIFSNIAVNNTLSHDDAWLLAQQVGLADDIMRMPMRMHTYISDNAGESVSGGQRQKILLARALASKPSILLLDEATSALDEASQALVFEHIASLNITRVVVAHRYSTIMHADVVCSLSKN